MLKNDDFRPFTLFVNTVFVYCTMTSFLQPPEMGVDRISYLPKEVLCHILSFLPTKLTVRTSILSKNWRYLWDSVSALDFDDTLLFNPNKGGFHGIGGVNFINFVDRVLIRNSESPTHMFGLCCSRRHSFHLNAWINNAIKRKLRVLSLSLDKVKDYTLAIAPFASEILVVLNLGRNFELDISGSFLFLGDVSTIGLKPLTGTYNAKFLSLSGRSMKVRLSVLLCCGVNTSGLHVFSNLTQLKLGCNEYCGQLLPKLLEKSPNLEVLILGKDNAKLNTRDLVKIHMGATAVRS
ncbi:hypothetical protein Gorai_019917 [Gossypium raimondii]|uniref:F-box domain-containing protein n=1 Tax=Gossypium raimondii TaxID=29730 RepID=A0A7J8PQ44_GOSRA|nr:hypothetical protein [Gossypium raimondii]